MVLLGETITTLSLFDQLVDVRFEDFFLGDPLFHFFDISPLFGSPLLIDPCSLFFI